MQVWKEEVLVSKKRFGHVFSSPFVEASVRVTGMQDVSGLLLCNQFFFFLPAGNFFLGQAKPKKYILSRSSASRVWLRIG